MKAKFREEEGIVGIPVIPCVKLLRASPDFHDTLKDHCPLCSGSGGECIMDLLDDMERVTRG